MKTDKKDRKQRTLERVNIETLVFIGQFLPLQRVFQVRPLSIIRRYNSIGQAKAIELPSDCDDRFALAMVLEQGSHLGKPTIHAESTSCDLPPS